MKPLPAWVFMLRSGIYIFFKNHIIEAYMAVWLAGWLVVLGSCKIIIFTEHILDLFLWFRACFKSKAVAALLGWMIFQKKISLQGPLFGPWCDVKHTIRRPKNVEGGSLDNVYTYTYVYKSSPTLQKFASSIFFTLIDCFNKPYVKWIFKYMLCLLFYSLLFMYVPLSDLKKAFDSSIIHIC